MIIGLTGRMGAGKDHLFQQLKEAYGIAVRLAFADGVKLDIADTLQLSGWGEDALYEKPYKPEIRRLLQWWGTELRRAEDPDYWIKHAASRAATYVNIDRNFKRRTLIVFTDVRFINEAQWIQSQGGKVVHVAAPMTIRAERLGLSLEQVARLAHHPSEAEVDHIQEDRSVLNNANDDHAAGQLLSFVSEWLRDEEL